MLILRSFGNLKTIVKPLGTDTYLIWTPLYYGQFVWSQQNANLFSLEITSVILTLSHTDNGHFITFPKKRNLFSKDTHVRHSKHFLLSDSIVTLDKFLISGPAWVYFCWHVVISKAAFLIKRNFVYQRNIIVSRRNCSDLRITAV